MADIAKFLSCNNVLQHLDLTGCEFKDEILKVIDQIVASQSLLAVHLSDNKISNEAKKIIYDKFELNHSEIHRDPP